MVVVALVITYSAVALGVAGAVAVVVAVAVAGLAALVAVVRRRVGRQASKQIFGQLKRCSQKEKPDLVSECIIIGLSNSLNRHFDELVVSTRTRTSQKVLESSRVLAWTGKF